MSSFPILAAGPCAVYLSFGPLLTALILDNKLQSWKCALQALHILHADIEVDDNKDTALCQLGLNY